MILVDHEIKRAVREKEVVIEGFEEEYIESATYDMRVGPQALSSTAKGLINLDKEKFITIEPSSLIMVNTFECLTLPINIAARCGLKSGLLRRGIFASIGPQIDPGYEGKLFLSLVNLTPIPTALQYKERFISIEFHRLEVPPEHPYRGPYQGRREFTAEEIRQMQTYEGLNLAEIHKGFTDLSSHIKSLAGLDKRLEELMAQHREEVKTILQQNAIEIDRLMNDNTKLIKEMHRLVDHIVKESQKEIVLRSISRKQAKEEIIDLFKGEGTLYYSDIAERLRLDLQLVVELCNELEAEDKIGSVLK